MRAITILPLLLAALLCLGAGEGLLPGKVTRVVDGDTIDVLLSP